MSVWVTVTKVRAHISDTAGEGEGGWVDLVDLTDNPIQIDLLSQDSTECFLAVLGSTTGLPPGTYQQIRIHLLSNTPPAGAATPTPNMCDGTGGFNCVDSVTNGLEILLLSSQPNTGIKIPPGQIAGGGIVLEPDQPADINIDFDACRSVHQLGNGSYRLKPTLHAGEVSLQTSLISGKVVDSATGVAITGNPTIIVAAEQPDGAGIDRVVAQTLANPADGSFLICPLAAGVYDLVVSAQVPGGATFGPTVLFDAPVGANVGNIPLVAVTGAATTAATIMGQVTTTDPAAVATSADVTVSALQSATPPAGAAIMVTVPTFPGSVTGITTVAGACPAGTNCADYMLIVVAANPSVGLFAPGGSTFSVPAVAPVPISVNAQAFVPDGTATPNCVPSSITTSTDIAAMPLTVTPGMISTAAVTAFVMCTAGFP